jgi:hypothetical protein
MDVENFPEDLIFPGNSAAPFSRRFSAFIFSTQDFLLPSFVSVEALLHPPFFLLNSPLPSRSVRDTYPWANPRGPAEAGARDAIRR